MALQPSNKSIPLFGGIDTKMDPKYVAFDKSLTAQNVQYFGVNRTRKRYGQTPLPQTIANGDANITVGKAIGNFNNELLIYDGTTVYSYSQAQSNWVSRGALTEVSVNRTPIVRTSGSVSGVASIVAGNAEIYAWEDSRGGIYYCIRDSLSGTMLVPNTSLGGGFSRPQLVASGSAVYLFYTDGISIFAAKFLIANLSAGVVSINLLTGSFSNIFAVASTSTQILLTWPLSTTTWNAKLFTSALVSTATNSFAITVAAGATPTALAYSTDASTALLATVDPGTGIGRTIFINTTTAAGTSLSTFGTPTGAGSLHLGAVATTTNSFRLFFDWTAFGALAAGVGSTTVPQTGTSPPDVTTYGLNLAAQPVLVGTQIYIIAMSSLLNLSGGAAQQPAFYLMNGSGSILQRFSGENAFLGGTVIPHIQLLTDGRLFVGLAERTQLRADANGTIYSVAGLTSTYFTFPAVSNVQIVQFGNTALISCGNTYTYDGSNIVESGFWDFPDGISTVVAAGGNLNAGIYIYIVTYEWQDAAGNVHYSETSYPIQVGTLAAPIALNSQVTLTIPYTDLTRKVGVTVNIYRTATAPGNAALLDTGLGPWFKIKSVPNLTNGTASFTYVDTVTDASIQGQQFLYSPPDGTGELENFAPPPFAFMVATKTRVFGLAQDNPSTLWYSKPLVTGRPADFSLFQTLQIETNGGAVTALAALDTTAVIFKSNRVYYIPGDGPNSAGNGTFFPPPQLITSTSGCISQPSVLASSDGVFFKSSLGLQLLNRSLQMAPTIGLPVQGFVDLSLTGAQAITGQNQLRWTSKEGTALVYDYVTQRWCTYNGYDAVGYAAWNGTFARLRVDGSVWYEDQTTNLDNGAVIPMILETSWIKLADMAQGYAAIWYAMILGEFRDNHTLTIEIAYDYTDVPTQTVVFTPETNIDPYIFTCRKY